MLFLALIAPLSINLAALELIVLSEWWNKSTSSSTVISYSPNWRNPYIKPLNHYRKGTLTILKVLRTEPQTGKLSLATTNSTCHLVQSPEPWKQVLLVIGGCKFGSALALATDCSNTFIGLSHTRLLHCIYVPVELVPPNLASVSQSTFLLLKLVQFSELFLPLFELSRALHLRLPLQVLVVKASILLETSVALTFY